MFFIIVIGFIVGLIYVFSTRKQKYWKKRGVKHDKPLPFFGNNLRQFLQLISVSEQITKVYKKYPQERFVGYYLCNEKVLILRDPELIRRVLVTDFHHFHQRGANFHKHVFEPLMKNLFTVDGDIWKLLRQRMTPAFTSGKLKAMFPLIVDRAEKLQKIAAAAAETGKEVDVRDLMARYTTDFIGACGFGIDADTLNDDNSSFRELGRRIFTITKRDAFIILLKVLAPEAFKNIHFFAPEIETNMVSLVKSILQQRNYKSSGRNDFIDLLLELKDKGKIIGESVEKLNSDGSPQIVELELDELLMTAQVFIFFAAGFETSSSTTSFTLHQLAFHPEEQKNCQEEIDQVLRRHGGKLSYEAIKEMKYLERAFRYSTFYSYVKLDPIE